MSAKSYHRRTCGIVAFRHQQTSDVWAGPETEPPMPPVPDMEELAGTIAALLPLLPAEGVTSHRLAETLAGPDASDARVRQMRALSRQLVESRHPIAVAFNARLGLWLCPSPDGQPASPLASEVPPVPANDNPSTRAASAANQGALS